MNPFSLEYTEDADEMLAWSWLIAKDRKAVTAAQFQIDQLLSQSPTNGQKSAEGLWKIVVPPLVACYEIDEKKSLVTVTGFGLLV